MARIKGKDLYLKDDDQIYLGDNQEAAIWYDNNELRVNHTISGTTATKPYHLIQKQYVDDISTAVSGIAVALPTTSGTPGDVFYHPDEGIPYYYDGNRERWLTASRVPFILSKSGPAKGVYLRIGGINDSQAGYYIHHDSTITAIYCRAVSGPVDKAFTIRYSPTSTGTTNIDLYNFSFNGSDTLYTNSAMVVDIDAGSIVKCWVSDTGDQVDECVLQVEFAWRYDVE